jgi:flagellar hook-length control protein FliK
MTGANGIAANIAPGTASAPANAQTSVQLTHAPATPNLNSLAVEISAKSQSGAKQFDIRLDPPELGRVDVRLSIDAAGKVQAHMTADQPQTLDLLQKDSSSLTQALRDAGLDVSQNGLAFSLKDQSHQGGNDQSGGRRMPGLTAVNTIEAAPSGVTYSSAGSGDARLDIHV